MRYMMFLLILFTSYFTNAQKLRITKMNLDYQKFDNVGDFDYLNDDADLSTFNWIANLTVAFDTIYPKTIFKVFDMLQEKSNRLGANSFRIINSDIYTAGNSKFIEISVYYLNRENRKENFDFFRSGDVVVFGFLGHHKSIEGYEIEFGTDRFVLHELEFNRKTLQDGQKISIRLGKGMKVYEKIHVKNPNSLPTYLMFEEFKGAFKTGVISTYPLNFGEFLIRILNERHF